MPNIFPPSLACEKIVGGSGPQNQLQVSGISETRSSEGIDPRIRPKGPRGMRRQMGSTKASFFTRLKPENEGVPDRKEKIVPPESAKTRQTRQWDGTLSSVYLFPNELSYTVSRCSLSLSRARPHRAFCCGDGLIIQCRRMARCSMPTLGKIITE